MNGSWSPSSSSQTDCDGGIRTLIDENAHHASANRGTSLALRHARIHGRTIASCFGKSMIRAAFSLAAAALRRVRQDQRRLVMNNSVTGLDLNFEGSNNRR